MAGDERCKACLGSGYLVLSDHGGISAECDCAANIRDMGPRWINPFRHAWKQTQERFPWPW